MMKLNITVEMDNAAFGDTIEDQALEVDRILHGLVVHFRRGDDAGTLRDSNGNTVGSWAISTGEAES